MHGPTQKGLQYISTLSHLKLQRQFSEHCNEKAVCSSKVHLKTQENDSPHYYNLILQTFSTSVEPFISLFLKLASHNT